MKFPFKIFYNIEPTGGDAGGGGAVEAPSQESGMNSAVTESSMGTQDTPSGSSAAESGTGESQESSVLDSSPGERGSSEYIDWFNDLQHDDQVKVEQEWNEGYEKKPAAEGDGQPRPDENTPPAEGAQKPPVPGEDVGEWTDEEFAKLDPISQTRIQAMQGIISEFEPYMDGSLDKGLEILESDPLIKARVAEIQNGGQNSLPAEITAKFDPNKYLEPEDLKHFSLMDDKAKSSYSGALSKAFEDGARQGTMREQYASNQALLVQTRITDFTSQLNTIISETPSLASSVPKDAEGKSVPYSDPSHPMNDYLKWAGGDKGLGDDWLATHGHKAGYAAYLAASGQQDTAMANVANNARTQFIKNMEKADKTIATTPGAGMQTPTPQGKTMDGIDLDKYKVDMPYRRSAFDGANQDLRKRLEHFMYSGEITQAR